MRKLVNGVLVEMTPEEEAQFEASRARTVAHARAEKKAAILARWQQAEGLGRFLEEPGDPEAKRRVSTANARKLWADVKNANTLAEIDSIDIEAGW